MIDGLDAIANGLFIQATGYSNADGRGKPFFLLFFTQEIRVGDRRANFLVPRSHETSF
jgi:hypothetical protein